MNASEWKRWFETKVKPKPESKPVKPRKVELKSKLDDKEVSQLVARRMKQHQREEKKRRRHQQRIRFARLCEQLSPFGEAMRLVGLVASKPKYQPKPKIGLLGEKLKEAGVC